MQARGRLAFRLAFLIGILLLIILVVVGLFIGSTTPEQTMNALFGSGNTLNDVLVRDFRLPRVLLAVAIGASLSVAGAVMQAITRNPLADPGLLGINSGAYLAIVIGMHMGGSALGLNLLLWSLSGAAVAATAIYFISNMGRPGQLVLAGVAISAVVSGVAFSLTLMNQDIFNHVRFWAAGSLDSRQISTLYWVAPLMAAGLLIALLLTRALNAIAMGKEMAQGLGAKAERIQFWSYATIVLLCAASTAAVGPISFLALMVPHIVRIVSGPDQRRIITFCLIVGPICFLGSDIIGRLIHPSEVPVGIVIAFVGAPVLISLARKVKAL